MKLYNLKEAAEFVGDSENQLKELARMKVIRGWYFRGNWLFTELELLKLLASTDFFNAA